MPGNTEGVGIRRAFVRFESMLEGWPSGALTVALLIAAGVLVLIALRGTATEKAIAAAYVYFP